MFKRVLLASVVAFLCACGGNDETPLLHVDTPSSEALTGFERGKVLKKDLTKIGDVLRVRRAIKLEQREGALIGVVRQIVRLDDALFVLDDIQNKVLKFDSDGHFVGEIGRRGQGPGEFDSVNQLLVNNGELGLVDASGAQILFFKGDGQFIEKFSFVSDLKVGSSRNIFFDGDSIFVAEAGRAASKSAHLALKNQDGVISKAFGFGSRMNHVEDVNLTLVHTYFKRFGNAIWSISPYSSDIYVYDLKGRMMHRLPPGFEALTYEDTLTAKNDSEFKALAMKKGFIYKAVANNNVLLAYFSKSGRNPPITIYGKDGSLQARVQGGSLLYDQIYGSHEDVFLAAVNLNEFSEKALRMHITEEDLNTIVDHGLDFEQFKKSDHTWVIELEVR